LENDLIIQQFEAIEQRVEKLIESRRELEEKNTELKNQVSRLEGELLEKQEMENKYQEEKHLVRSRIDGLLTKLNTIAED
jgi:chromosome segregation ATPase